MRRIHRVSTAVIALVMLQACDDNRGPTSPTPSSPGIRGTVLDFHTQTPISGALVRVTTEPRGGGTEAVTDVDGRYSLPLPPHIGRPYYFVVNNSHAGSAYPVGSNYRGDLLVDTGTCVSRYGVVADARTLRPIAGASVGSNVTTTSDGWYRIDWGCPSSGTIGINTTFLGVSHPRYIKKSQVLGRGIQRVERLDFLLEAR